MDQRVIDELVKLRADTEVSRAILGQLLTFFALNMTEPQKAIAEMHQKVKQRLSSIVTQDAAGTHAMARLDSFFESIDRSLSQMARGPGQQKPN